MHFNQRCGRSVGEEVQPSPSQVINHLIFGVSVITVGKKKKSHLNGGNILQANITWNDFVSATCLFFMSIFTVS